MPVQDLASKGVQRLEWHGERIKRNMRRAEARAIGFVRAVAVRHAKKNHPGWKRRTGRAEKSIKAQGRIQREGNVAFGQWGSKLFYVTFLEIDHGAFMRAAADAHYPKLAGKIRDFFKEQTGVDLG